MTVNCPFSSELEIGTGAFREDWQCVCLCGETSVSATISVCGGPLPPFRGSSRRLTGTALSFLPWGAVPLSSPVQARGGIVSFSKRQCRSRLRATGWEGAPNLLRQSVPQSAHNQSDRCWGGGSAERGYLSVCGGQNRFSWLQHLKHTHMHLNNTHTCVHTHYNLGRGGVETVRWRGSVG